jgi:hypothetical protein
MLCGFVSAGLSMLLLMTSCGDWLRAYVLPNGLRCFLDWRKPRRLLKQPKQLHVSTGQLAHARIYALQC